MGNLINLNYANYQDVPKVSTVSGIASKLENGEIIYCTGDSSYYKWYDHTSGLYDSTWTFNSVPVYSSTDYTNLGIGGTWTDENVLAGSLYIPLRPTTLSGYGDTFGDVYILCICDYTSSTDKWIAYSTTKGWIKLSGTEGTSGFAFSAYISAPTIHISTGDLEILTDPAIRSALESSATVVTERVSSYVRLKKEGE